MASKFLSIIALIQFLFSQFSAANDNTPLASVRNGTLEGIYSQSYHQDFFLGIPYAQPPVGDLRFRQAQALNSTWSGTKEVTAYSPNCIGYGSDDWANDLKVSEDCLTLNVIRPAGVSEGEKLPVAFWIFGGGLTEGGAADPRYNLSFIIQQSVYQGTPTIGVSINYRLQAWGFLFGQEVLDAGLSNIGLRDQRLAMRWVHENIEAFGGDPAKVTIWGESAGASSVGVHLTAYNGRDDNLFRGAILESGAPKGSFVTASGAQATFDNITSATNCSSAVDALACLRLVPTDTLSSIFNSSTTSSSTFGPQLDHDLITGSATDQLRNGQFVHVPVLIGRNHDEGTSFSTKGINSDAEFMTYLGNKGYDNTTSTVLAALYPDIPEIGIPGTLLDRPAANSTLGQQWKRVSAFAGDVGQHAYRRIQSQAWAKYNVTSYSYVFNVWPAGIPDYTGVTHFTEVSFMMHNIQGYGYNTSVASDPFAGKPKTYTQVATMMSRNWVSFFANLTPNYIGAPVKWPPYTAEDPRNIVYDVNTTGLAYIEPDTYRAEGIAYLMSLL